MPTYRFKQVDVFTDRPFFGNPVAVVLDADDIDNAEMQRIAAWTNLSETTFVQRPSTPEADYRLRIFCPTEELPFAGHPTVGSAHAVLEAGVVSSANGRVVQECGAGNLRLRIEGEGAERRIWVLAPEAKIVKDHSDAADAVSAALGTIVSHEHSLLATDNGPVWLFVHLDRDDVVRRLEPDVTAVARLSRELGLTGIATFALPGGEAPVIHIRCFAPAFGAPEDPVTGSANAALPTYLARVGLLAKLGREYIATQGTEIGRDGHIFVRVLDDNDRAEIGGHAMAVIEGEIRL